MPSLLNIITITLTISSDTQVANYLFNKFKSISMAEQNSPTVQPEEQCQDSEAKLTGLETAPHEPQSIEPSGPVYSPIVEGSLALIGKGTKIQFPKALLAIGGPRFSR